MNPNNERLNKKVRREAQLFAKLNHEHVVRYYAAWIENVPLESSSNSTQSTSSLSIKDLDIKKLTLLKNEKKESTEWDPSFQKIDKTSSKEQSSSSEGKGLWRTFTNS